MLLQQETLMRKAILLAFLAVSVAMGSQLATAGDSLQPLPIWHDMALDTVHAESLSAFPAIRLDAMVDVAMHDAVNGIHVTRGWSQLSRGFVAPALCASHPNLAAGYGTHAV